LAVTTALLAAIFLALIAQLADQSAGADRVDLDVRMWNIDDEGAVYVNCKNVLEARGAARRETRLEVEPDAVVTVQVDNDRYGYSWGIRVSAGDRTIMLSERGHAQYLGANGNDMARAFETVFDKSVRLDGTPTTTPRCVRI
jgi:hypothetical protein